MLADADGDQHRAAEAGVGGGVQDGVERRVERRDKGRVEAILAGVHGQHERGRSGRRMRGKGEALKGNAAAELGRHG